MHPKFTFEQTSKNFIYEVTNLYLNFFENSPDKMFIQELKNIIASNY